MSSGVYNSAKVGLANGTIDLDTDTIKVMLVKSTYTPDFDADNYRDDVTSFESTGTNYTSGGSAIGSKTVTQDNTNNRMVFDGADITWTNTTIADYRYAVGYKSRGGAASADELIFCIDRGSTGSTTAQDLVITWSAANGIITNA